MSTYHIIGIRKLDGTIQSLTSGDDWSTVQGVALNYALHYRQLFLIQAGLNVQGLEYTPPSSGGLRKAGFSPVVDA